MRLDYSEKRVARESVERKPVQKNRPRKEPGGGMFALLSAVALLVTFGAGVLTGWFLFKRTHKAPPPVAAVAQPVKQQEPAPPADWQNPAGPDAPLTFYKTLPAGGKGVIGSGLNPTKTAPAASAPRPAPDAAPATAAPPAAAPAEAKQEAARFVVQVASYRDKQEADAAQARLSARGVAAYVLESKLQDKSVWYRVRVGRQLTKTEADALAAKAGKGAVVLSE